MSAQRKLFGFDDEPDDASRARVQRMLDEFMAIMNPDVPPEPKEIDQVRPIWNDRMILRDWDRLGMEHITTVGGELVSPTLAAQFHPFVALRMEELRRGANPSTPHVFAADYFSERGGDDDDADNRYLGS